MFTDRENTVFVVIDVHEVNEDVVDDINAGANELQEQYGELHGRKLDAWVGWADIPREEYIVGFWRGGPRRLSFNQIWKTLPENFDRDGLNGMTYQYVHSVPESEIGMTVQQRNQMRKLVHYIANNYPETLHPDLSADGCCIRMECLLEPPFVEIIDEYRLREG